MRFWLCLLWTISVQKYSKYAKLHVRLVFIDARFSINDKELCKKQIRVVLHVWGWLNQRKKEAEMKGHIVSKRRSMSKKDSSELHITNKKTASDETGINSHILIDHCIKRKQDPFFIRINLVMYSLCSLHTLKPFRWVHDLVVEYRDFQAQNLIQWS